MECKTTIWRHGSQCRVQISKYRFLGDIFLLTNAISPRTIIPVLEKDKSASHECAIVFFTPGRFKANIQCKSLAASTTKPLPNGHINFQIPQPGGLSTTMSYHEMQSHLWKFIPPIELTVLE